MARERKEGKKGLGVFQFPGEAAGVRALNATAFQVEAKATSSGLRRIQLTPSFLVTPTGPFPSPLPPLREIDSRVEEAFPGTAFLMVISPQHHLPAAAAPAPCAASGPRGPETRRRAGSRQPQSGPSRSAARTVGVQLRASRSPSPAYQGTERVLEPRPSFLGSCGRPGVRPLLSASAPGAG